MVKNTQSACKIAKFLKHIKISRPIFKKRPTCSAQTFHPFTTKNDTRTDAKIASFESQKKHELHMG